MSFRQLEETHLTMAKFNVYALGNPLTDLQVQVDDEFVASLGAVKGSVRLIDRDEYDALIPKLEGLTVHIAAGGSAANTMLGVQMLGGTTCFTGKIGPDPFGTVYRNSMVSRGVEANLGIGESPTGLCIILITPDAQRTMFTYLGACRELGPEDVNLAALADSEYLYLTGYLWDTESQKQAVLHAMQHARKEGVSIAMSLADPFCVSRHKDDFRRIVEEHVDLLFGNQEEAEIFTDTASAEEALRALAPLCEIAVVTMSAAGSLIAHGGKVDFIEAYPVRAVDSTGAGDMYAAGLLYGLTQKISLPVTGRLASYLAGQVVAQLGPRLERIEREAVEAVLGE